MKIKLFDEMFSCYFSTIYRVLKESANKELTDSELHKLISKTSDYYGFPITDFIVRCAIDAGKNEDAIDDKDAWPFFDRVQKMIKSVGGIVEKPIYVNQNRLNNLSTIPLSKIEKMWLKSIYSDPRIKLFMKDNTEIPELQDIEPLFDWDDFVLFDRYSDGDPYKDEHYIEMFKKVREAVRNHARLKINFRKANNNIKFDQKGSYSRVSEKETGILYIDAEYLEYSERDDKFRLVGNNPRFGRNTVNIASIISCDEVEKTETSNIDLQGHNSKVDFHKKVVFELTDDRNALERFLMNFSHYEKEAEFLQDRKRYRIIIYYDEADEKDVVIRVLSFGPYVKVVHPDCFIALIADRLKKQLNIYNTQKNDNT